MTGVEACMWSECVATTLPFACARAGLSGGVACVRRWVDGSNFAGRFWPRAAAIAERGWSPKATTGIDDFRRRIHKLSCELKWRGLPAEPVVHGGRFFRENGTVCNTRQPRVLGPPSDGCLPRFSSCAAV